MIRSICPKCGQEGIQSVIAPNKSKPNLRYLRFLHPKKQQCYIGRIKTTDEAMGELNKPETSDEYMAVIREITSWANTLLEPRRGHGGPQIWNELKTILEKYGLWS